MNDIRFDNPARWWFLTPDGFTAFRDDPVAQGYEILSRHPSFPHILVKMEHGKPIIFWDHANKHLPKKTWQELDQKARSAFLFKYRYDLHRMGLLEIAWLGKKVIIFNCTEGVPSILAAVHCWLEWIGLFKRASKNQRERMRADPEWFKWSFNRTNPDMVTLDWSKLVKQCKEDCTRRFSDDIVAAVRTFLEHNPKYRQHRQRRLAELKERNKEREKRLVELNKKRPPRHLEKASPSVIALACVAWDCQQAGTLFQETITTTHLVAIGRDRLKAGDSRNHLRELRKLQIRTGFKITRLSTRPAKQTTVTESPINVISIQYPHFRTDH